VLSWHQSDAQDPIWVRFEDLITDPQSTVVAAVREAAPEQTQVEHAQLPTFGELHGREPGFFRSGTTGSHQTELPADLHELFWEQRDNATAMNLVGYQT
jgi:hypothetical protein